jgi:hypothetical protein
MKWAAFALWLVCVSIAGFATGTMTQQEKGASLIPGGRKLNLPCCAMVEDIPMQIVRAALRHGISPSRALARAYNESKYQDIDSACCRSVFQLHKRYFPEMPLDQHIDVATAHLAMLIRKYGAPAERVYRTGHP